MKLAIFWVVLNAAGAAWGIAAGDAILPIFNAFVAGLWSCVLVYELRDA